MHADRFAGYLSPIALATVACCATAAGDHAAGQPEAAPLGTITVTATRLPEPAFDVPASIDVVDGTRLRDDTLAVNLSEGLDAVAGLMARDRQNYAQDTQLSIRGFGTRSAFGIRGVRLYVDGIPATQPDGQGQISHFNLASAGHVEVLRGPFSALYGNSSGGVIQLFTADGSAEPVIYGGFAGGSYDTYRENIGASGTLGSADYNFAFSNFKTEGFRDHSAAERRSFNGKVNLQLSDADRLTVVLNNFDSPKAQDPLGMTRSQFNDDPAQATSVATQYNTRKRVRQTQGGLIYEHHFSTSQSVQLTSYFGQRDVLQFLSIPPSAQASPTASGGVVDLGTGYGGTEARWSYRGGNDAQPWAIVVGLDYDDLRQHRQGYENFVDNGDGDATLGVRGAERRDEIDTVWNFDQFLQGSWRFAERWTVQAGVRHSRVAFKSNDHYLTDNNPDDSGSARYSATTPVAGLMFHVTDSTRAYVSYGRGFETPTLAELAYRPSGSAGLNFDLDPARSDNAELGMKLRFGANTHAQLALFNADTRHELIVLSNSGGRSTYGNTGRTRRQGAELEFDSRLAQQWRFELAYTLLSAHVRERYQACSGTPCTSLNTTIPTGARVPGIARSNLYMQLGWGGETGWHLHVDMRYLSRVTVNDTNSEAAPSYGIVGLETGYVFDLPTVRIRTFVNFDNLLNRDYVGSVIVNDGNGRYYEPGPGFSMLAGFALSWKP